MPQVVNLVLVLVLVVVPLFAVFGARAWPRNQVRALLIGLPLLLFLVNAPLHEAAHVVATYLAGGTVGRVNLIQRFWVPNAPTAMIETEGVRTTTQGFVVAVAPYILDAVLLVCAAALLLRPRLRSPWLFGLSFLVLVLRPSFDIAANTIAALVYGIGDFRQAADLVGPVAAEAIQAGLLATALALTLGYVRVYRTS